MAVSCSRNMNFVKCQVSETSEESFSMFDNFLHFLRIFALGPFFADQVELTKHPPYILIFHVVTPPPPLTQQYFFLILPPPPPNLLINDWSHRSRSFLNILLFRILPQSSEIKRLFLRPLMTTVYLHPWPTDSSHIFLLKLVLVSSYT